MLIYQRTMCFWMTTPFPGPTEYYPWSKIREYQIFLHNLISRYQGQYKLLFICVLTLKDWTHIYLLNRETKLQKEHDMACNRLKDWKRRFALNLEACNKEVCRIFCLNLLLKHQLNSIKWIHKRISMTTLTASDIHFLHKFSDHGVQTQRQNVGSWTVCHSTTGYCQ